MRNISILIILSLVLLVACSGKDKITTDDTPPQKPILIPHLGDFCDQITRYKENRIILTDENNGIDAVPDGDWIRISWEHLLDTDLDYVKIFRFDNNPSSIVHPTTMIDSVQYDPVKDYYVDNRNQLQTNIRYSYFIEVVDNDGNTAVSDTVSYGLLSKQILISPAPNSNVSRTNVRFEWQKSGIVSRFRVIVLDASHEYLWHQDVQVTTQGDYFYTVWPNNITGQYLGDMIYWRVDAFEWDSELNIFIGSESTEQTVYLN